MSKNRAWVVIIAITILFTTGLAYTDYKLHGAYKSQKNVGYKSSCKGLASPTFTRGDWMGVLIDDNIKYTDGAHNIIPYDIDGDGKVELIANSYRTDALILYKYDDGPHSLLNWSRYVIDSCVGGGNPRRPIIKFIKSTLKEKLLGGFTSGTHYTAIADLNNDTRNDLSVAGDYRRYDIIWYEAPKDITDISAWQKHIIYQNNSHRVYHIEVGDIDGDDDLDIVTGNHQGDVYVLENPYPNNVGHGQEWSKYKVSHSDASIREIDIADIDRDGDSDIIVADESENMVIWFENSGITFYENWKRHVIDHSNDYLRWCHSVELGDVDGDGDLDIAVAAASGNVFLLYFNNLTKQGRKQ